MLLPPARIRRNPPSFFDPARVLLVCLLLVPVGRNSQPEAATIWPVETFRWPSSQARWKKGIMGYGMGFDMGFWEFRKPLRDFQFRVYRHFTRESHRFILHCLESSDRLVRAWGINYWNRLLEARDAEKNIRQKKRQSQMLARLEKEVLTRLRRREFRRNWLLFDFLRQKRFFRNIRFKRSFLKDGWFRDAQFDREPFFSVAGYVRRLSGSPQLAGDPRMVDFFQENNEAIKEHLYQTKQDFSHAVWQGLETELAWLGRQYEFFAEDYTRKVPPALVSYVDYSRLAGRDYFTPVPLGLAGLETSPYHRSRQEHLTREFINVYGFHPGLNDAYYRLARIEEWNKNWKAAIALYLRQESFYDPYDSHVLTAQAWRRINMIFHTALPRVTLLEIAKSTRDLRLRFWAVLAAANRFFCERRYYRAEHYYRTARQLVRLFQEKKYGFFSNRHRAQLEADLKSRVALNRHLSLWSQKFYNGKTPEEKARVAYALGKYYYSKNDFLSLPGFEAEKIYKHFAVASPDSLRPEFFYYKATTNYQAMRYFEMAARSATGDARARSLYSAANASLRLSYARYQFLADTRYDRSFWEKKAFEFYGRLDREFPGHSLRARSQYVRAVLRREAAPKKNKEKSLPGKAERE